MGVKDGEGVEGPPPKGHKSENVCEDNCQPSWWPESKTISEWLWPSSSWTSEKFSMRGWGWGSHQPLFLVPLLQGMVLLVFFFFFLIYFLINYELLTSGKLVCDWRNILASLGGCLFCIFLNVEASYLWPLSEGISHIQILLCIRNRSSRFSEFWREGGFNFAIHSNF